MQNGSQVRPSAQSIMALLRSVGRTLDVEKTKWDEDELRSAPRFNNFSFFSRREEAVSRVIAALLNPDGLHGQGRLFLDKFIAHVKNRNLTAATKQSAVRSIKPEFTTKGKRRIDVVISFQNGFNLGIESKIFDADEQVDQVSHYITDLQDRGDFVFIFLHKTGGTCESLEPGECEALQQQGKLFLAPAKSFLKDWLTDCMKSGECKAPPVNRFMTHLLAYIENPPEESFMKSAAVRTQVVQHILSSSQALQSVIALREHLETAVQTVTAEFVNELYKSLERRLKSLPSKRGLKWSMEHLVVQWHGEDSKPTIHPQTKPYPPTFENDEWRYVGFRLNDILAVTFEWGFTEASRLAGSGGTVGVHKLGPFKYVDKYGWTNSANMKVAQQLVMKKSLNDLRSDLFYDGGDSYRDWYWHRYLDSSFDLLSENQKDYNHAAIGKFYSAVNDKSDRTIAELANFMVRISETVFETV